MKILHVVPTYFPAVRYGGPIYSVHGLCRALVSIGHEVHVFTTNVDGRSESDVLLEQGVNLDGVQVWYFSSQWLRRLYFSPQMMTMLEEKIPQFDLVHLHSVFLWPTWAAARVARRNSVPYVLSPRGMLVKDLIRKKRCWLKTCWIWLIEKNNIEQAAAMHVTSSEEGRELYRFSFSLPKIAMIENGVATVSAWSADEVSEDVRIAIKPPGYVLYFGRISWKKGLKRLLDVWKDIPDARLIIAGNDEENYVPQLKKYVKEKGVQDQVTFLTRSLTGADKEALFAAARLFVLPSYSENFGITVLEAMLRRLPVVVTSKVGSAEIVRKSGGGKVADVSELGLVIAGMLSNKQHLEEMGIAGERHVLSMYLWKHIAGKMEQLYREITDA